MEWIYTQNFRDALSWQLAYSFEKLPKRWLLDLKNFLDLQNNKNREKLFLHWLSERGLSEIDFDDYALTKAKGLAIYGFFRSEAGVGQAVRAYAGAFRTSSLPLSSHELSLKHCENSVDFSASKNLENELNTALLALNADQMQKIECWMDPKFVKRNYRINLLFWELPVFPAMWANALCNVDEIWVASEFIAQSLGSATTLPVRILPIPVPLNDLDQYSSRAKLNLPQDRLIYLINFDFNSYPERKNPMASIEAFCDAFPVNTSSSPLLIIKCHGVFNRERYEGLLRRAANENKNIKLIDRVFSYDDMRSLQAAIDVYVSLHRSEGYGLNLAECMAAGKVVIGTNFSGNLTFMDQHNSMLIDFQMKKLQKDGYIGWHGQWWADPSHDHAVAVLREIGEAASLRDRLGKQAYLSVKDKLSYERVGLQMSEYIH